MQISEIRKYVTDTFKELVFTEESHSYFVGNRQFISVSSQLKKFYEEFDADGIAPYSAAKWNRNNPFSAPKTAQDLKDEWNAISDKACVEGTRVHLFGEDYPNFREPICNQEKAIVKYYEDLDPKYIVLFLELQMYSPSLNYSGTGDIILYNTETGKISIRDWKTNGDLFKNFKGKTMLEPFTDLLDYPLHHYYLQLNFYKMLLENMTNLEVESMEVIWLKETEDNLYQTFEIPDLTKKLLPYYE